MVNTEGVHSDAVHRHFVNYLRMRSGTTIIALKGNTRLLERAALRFVGCSVEGTGNPLKRLLSRSPAQNTEIRIHDCIFDGWRASSEYPLPLHRSSTALHRSVVLLPYWPGKL